MEAPLKNNLHRNSIWLVLTTWVLAACLDTHTVYHSYQSIGNDGWEKSDTLFFKVPVYDSLTSLQLRAEVRNQSNYPYRNLYLTVSHNLQDSTVWKTDTLEFTLADTEGKWTGTGWGSLFQSTLTMPSATVLRPGTYTFKINHLMKDSRLKGLSDIGICVEN